jgi:hypothetical protein
MIWVEITYANVLLHMPTDIRARYEEWLVAYPEKAGRLQTITENTIREFRDAIKSSPENIVDPRETWLPQSAVRHAESIIIFSLAMEMGISIDSSGNSARYAADIFLRQIPFGRWNTTLEGDEYLPSPRFVIPERIEHTGRALPLVVCMLLLCLPAFGGWIRPESEIADWRVRMTFQPTAYTVASNSLFSHLSGINQALGGISTQYVRPSAVTSQLFSRVWLSTNSYLSGNSDPTSLYFVVINPPSTNQILP